jgi:Domain of unknown function (DUF4157)
MGTFAQKQNRSQKLVSSRLARPHKATSGSPHREHPLLHLQRTIGNQAVLRMLQTNAEEFKAGLTGMAPLRFGHDFSRIPAHSPAASAIRTKLAVNKPGDIYEQEADRVSEQVMHMRKPDLALGGGDSGRSDSARIQRECLECGEKEKEDEGGLLVPKSGALSLNPKAVAHGPHAAPGTEGSGGHSLPASVRGFFETRFGHDFGQVRVHADNNAAEMARGLHARAFTVGNDIYFGSSQYAPGTSSGNKLLAHELTHTIQQSRGSSPTVWGALGRTAPIALSSAPSSIQRKEEVRASLVTEENPLERLLKGEPAGLTTPFVNGVAFNNVDNLAAALPTKIGGFSAGSAANTCKLIKPIDVISQAKIITASAPGKTGWTASAPLATINKIAKITDKDCAAKKGDINVRMVAEIGNEAFAKWVRQAEGEHEAVVKEIHNKFLKPYHDFANTKEGSHKDRTECAIGLAKEIGAKRSQAILDWAKAWAASVDKLDSEGGPHKPEISFKAVGKCAEVLGTIKKQRKP